MNYVLNKDLLHQKYFEEISKIPHGSYNEQQLSNYIVNIAKELGYKYIQDEMGNVIVYKPASSGYENHATIILQAHIDMVCEKNIDCNHNFETDSLSLQVEDGWVKAKGTTLGADDGYGVAYMLALLTEKDIAHPALECVFTVQEEVGLFGAINLKKEYFSEKKFINLDNGSESNTYVSCAGALISTFTKSITYEKNSLPTYKIEVKGLSGGHSGGQIHLEKGNSIKIVTRILYHLNKNFGINLVNIDGGSKMNAIPREAFATFSCAENFETIDELVKNIEKEVKKELEFSDNGVYISLLKSNSEKIITKKESDEIINMLYLIPSGLQHRSLAFENLTTASQNLGVITTKENKIKFTVSLRGALESYNQEGMENLKFLSQLFNVSYVVDAHFSAWEYSPVSEFRERLKTLYKDFYQKDIQVLATHGGLECGIFKALIPELDIITLGPDCKNAHTPDEAMNLESFDKMYNFLKLLLSNL